MKILNADKQKVLAIAAERCGATSTREPGTKTIVTFDLSDCRCGIETVLEELILMVKDNSMVKGKNFIFFVFSWWRRIK